MKTKEFIQVQFRLTRYWEGTHEDLYMRVSISVHMNVALTQS